MIMSRSVFVCCLIYGLSSAHDKLPAQAVGSVGYALENGDVNGDLQRDVSDPVHLLLHLFSDAPAPVPLATCGGMPTFVRNGDTNGDGTRNISDVVHLLSWLYSGGVSPVAACGDGGGGQNANPRVIPPHARAHGQSYPEWAASWWQRMSALPTDGHPLFDQTGEDCDHGQDGSVWFLHGVFNESGSAERDCTVPPGKALFFPILNVIINNFEEDPPLTDEELLATAQFFGTGAVNLAVEVDGVALQNLDDYHVQTDIFEISAPADNIYGYPGGGTSHAADDGIYIMLAPLSKGEHRVSFSGTFLFTAEEHGFDFEFNLSIVYNLTVAR